MSDPDVKPSAVHDGGDIEVAEVTEILENDIEAGQADTDMAEVVDEVPSGGSLGSTCTASDRIASQREVIALLHAEFVQTNVVRPMHGVRSYAKEQALKKWIRVCVRNELKPLRPTKLCKKYLCFRLPYLNRLISFHETDMRYLRQRPKCSVRVQDPEPDLSALPISFDDYLDQMESSYTMFVESESPGPGSFADADTETDVTNIVKYKAHLLSWINSQIIQTILTTKATAEDFRCTISQSGNRKDQLQLELDWRKGLPFRPGLKVQVELPDAKVFGDVTSVLPYDEMVRLTVSLKKREGVEQELGGQTVVVRPFGLIGHLLLQAKTLITLEQFHLYTEFLDPVMKSLSSGIEIHFSDSFRHRYKNQTSFYIDSVQKIVDTVALDQSDVSHICIIDDYDPATLSDIFVDSVRYLIRKEEEIIDQLRAVTELRHGAVTDEDLTSLKMIIVSKSESVLDKLYRNLEDDAMTYSVKTATYEVVDFLKKKIDQSDDPEHKKVYELLRNKTAEGQSTLDYEMAKKTGRDIFLQYCPIVYGTIEELLNDESVGRMLQKKSRTFDVAIVHDASSFSDAELISLLLFGVSKFICFTVTAKQQGHTFADRMVRKASEANEVNSKSPVLDRSLYLQQEEQAAKEAEERRRASFAHAHSYRNNDAVRTVVDPLTRQCHDHQAQRTRPYMTHQRGRGYDHHGRGRQGNGSRDGNGRGGGAYQSLHYNRNGHNSGNRF